MLRSLNYACAHSIITFSASFPYEVLNLFSSVAWLTPRVSLSPSFDFSFRRLRIVVAFLHKVTQAHARPWKGTVQRSGCKTYLAFILLLVVVLFSVFITAIANKTVVLRWINYFLKAWLLIARARVHLRAKFIPFFFEVRLKDLITNHQISAARIFGKIPRFVASFTS